MGYIHRNESTFIQVWKNVAKTTVLYGFLLSCSMGLWYYALVPETINQRKTEQLELLQGIRQRFGRFSGRSKHKYHLGTAIRR